MVFAQPHPIVAADHLIFAAYSPLHAPQQVARGSFAMYVDDGGHADQHCNSADHQDGHPTLSPVLSHTGAVVILCVTGYITVITSLLTLLSVCIDNWEHFSNLA